MLAFLDFEASSLAKHSYPIEVAWVFEDGTRERHLIRPAPEWTDWDLRAERLHGLSREELEAKGEPHDTVARRVLEALSPHEVYASAPSWDGKWMSVLLRAGGLPRHALRLKPSGEIQLQAASEPFRAAAAGADPDQQAAEVLEAARRSLAAEPVNHRALEDADREWRLWREAGRLASQAAAEAASG